MVTICEHLHCSNFCILSKDAKLLWLYLVSRYDGRNPVWIHPKILQRLADIENVDSAIGELTSQGFYSSNDPFLIVENSYLIPSLWKCRSCFRLRPDRYIPDQIRAEVLAAGRCEHCGSTDLENLVVDHVQPLSRGGTNERENLQVLCAMCNLSKGNRFTG